MALLTKADKLKQGKRKAEVLQVKKKLAELDADITVCAFSSLKGIGLKELAWKLDDWYLGPYKPEDDVETESEPEQPDSE